MSQRDSGYARKERDLYETPEWVTLALLPHLPVIKGIVWEPAQGSGKMATALERFGGFGVIGSDIGAGNDFMLLNDLPNLMVAAIITNPPYELATEFIDHSLGLMEPSKGVVAMLLRTDFDHAKGRRRLFSGCVAFAKKVVLTRRIMWFEPEPGSKGKSPSFNHAWFIWDCRHTGAPTLAYGP